MNFFAAPSGSENGMKSENISRTCELASLKSKTCLAFLEKLRVDLVFAQHLESLFVNLWKTGRHS